MCESILRRTRFYGNETIPDDVEIIHTESAEENAVLYIWYLEPVETANE